MNKTNLKRYAPQARKDVIEAVTAVLGADEHASRLETELSRQHSAALAQMVAPPPVPTPPPAACDPGIRNFARRAADAEGLREVMETVRLELEQDASLRVDIECRVYRDGEGGDKA